MKRVKIYFLVALILCAFSVFAVSRVNAKAEVSSSWLYENDKAPSGFAYGFQDILLGNPQVKNIPEVVGIVYLTPDLLITFDEPEMVDFITNNYPFEFGIYGNDTFANFFFGEDPSEFHFVFSEVDEDGNDAHVLRGGWYDSDSITLANYAPLAVYPFKWSNSWSVSKGGEGGAPLSIEETYYAAKLLSAIFYRYFDIGGDYTWNADNYTVGGIYDYGYDTGNQTGFIDGFNDGHAQGFAEGHQQGYSEGLASGDVVNVNWLVSVVSTIGGILSLEIFPNVQLWVLVGLPLVLGALFLFLKLVR